MILMLWTLIIPKSRSPIYLSTILISTREMMKWFKKQSITLKSIMNTKKILLPWLKSKEIRQASKDGPNSTQSTKKNQRSNPKTREKKNSCLNKELRIIWDRSLSIITQIKLCQILFKTRGLGTLKESTSTL